MAVCGANRGSRRRSLSLRALGMEPKTSWPSSKAASIPEIHGDPSARTVATLVPVRVEQRRSVIGKQ